MSRSVFSIVLLFSIHAHADTVHFIDGGSWNGTVTFSGSDFRIEWNEENGKHKTKTYPASSIRRIDFNNTKVNQPILVQGCSIWALLWPPSDCGINRWGRMWRLYLYGDQFYGNSNSAIPSHYVPAKPPKLSKPKLIAQPAIHGGVFGELELVDTNQKLECFVLTIDKDNITVESGPPYTRPKVRSFALKPKPQ